MLSGEGRWLITAELRYFTDWYPLRLFTVGGAVFLRHGRDLQYLVETRKSF